MTQHSKQAAVLVLIYRKHGKNHLLLTKRSARLEIHPGEIAFPGGKKNLTDTDLIDTALRECEEEIGLNRNQVEVISALGCFTTISNFEITAFLAESTEQIKFKINPDEVSQIIELPLQVLLDSKFIRDDLWIVDDEITYKPSFGYEGHLIFGATARILDCFVQTPQLEAYNSESLEVS